MIAAAISGETLVNTIKGGKKISPAPLAQPLSGTSGATNATAGATPGAGGGAIGGVISKQNLGRTDMGVDFTGAGPVPAVVGGVVDMVVPRGGASGWPGGGYIHWKGSDGKFYYLAENIDPLVKVGDTIHAGQTIAHALGSYPYLEYGYASSTPNQTLAVAQGNTGGANHSNSPAGQQFLSFLHGLGL